MYSVAQAMPLYYVVPPIATKGLYKLDSAFSKAMSYNGKIFSNNKVMGEVVETAVKPAVQKNSTNIVSNSESKVSNILYDAVRILNNENTKTNTTKVGRWMSPTEYDTMVKTGKVSESFSGTTYVALPANINAFARQAKVGSIYVEFYVPSSSLKATNEGWSKIIGPNSIEGRLAFNKGQPISEMPPATNIEIKGKK